MLVKEWVEKFLTLDPDAELYFEWEGRNFRETYILELGYGRD